MYHILRPPGEGHSKVEDYRLGLFRQNLTASHHYSDGLGTVRAIGSDGHFLSREKAGDRQRFQSSLSIPFPVAAYLYLKGSGYVGKGMNHADILSHWLHNDAASTHQPSEGRRYVCLWQLKFPHYPPDIRCPA